MKDKNIEKIILQPLGVKNYYMIFDLELFEFSFFGEEYTEEDSEYI